MEVVLERIKHIEDIEMLGKIFVFDDDGNMIFNCVTLELPWLDNKVGESCIAEGIYRLDHHSSPTFGKCFWVKREDGHTVLEGGRTEILVHTGNFYTDLRGCIAPGADYKDIDGDEIYDVTFSRKTLNKLLEVVPDKTRFEIHDLYS